MQLKHNGFVHRVAFFNFNPNFENGPFVRPPLFVEQTNLCSVFWRFVLRLLLFIPVWACFFVAVFSLAVAVAVAVYVLTAIFVGYRPPWYDKDDGKDFAVPIQHWPKVNGKHVMPIFVILAIAGAWGAWRLGVIVWRALSNVPSAKVANGMEPFVPYLLIATAVCVVIYGIVKLFRSETWRMVRAYLKAKKQNICPIVTFVSTGTELVVSGKEESPR